MKILCLVDFPVGSSQWLWDYLPDHNDQVEFLCAPLNRRLMRHSKFLAYLLGFGWQAIQAAIRVSRNNYDLVVAWEGKNGFPFATLKRLLRRRNPRLVILAFSVRGLPLRFRSLALYALQSVDGITVSSLRDIEHYRESWGISTKCIAFCPPGVHEPFDSQVLSAQEIGDGGAYIFSGGYSHRDFRTLVAASRDLDMNLVIISPKANQPDEGLPPTIRWLDPVHPALYRKMMMNAYMVVIPLCNVPFVVGLMDLLNAMAAGKAIIMTRTFYAADYIENYRNGILVDPENPSALQQAMSYLIERPDEATRLGINARQLYEQQYTFQAFARRVHTLLMDMTTQLKEVPR